MSPAVKSFPETLLRPTVTRIVTVHRQWELLRSWISGESLRQPEVAWLFVNDAPGDPPPEDIRAAMDEMQARLVTPMFNCGRSNARNFGASLVSTPYLEHVDGDDIPLALHPDIMELLRKGSADLVSCPVVEWTSGSPMPDQTGYSRGSSDAAWWSLFPDGLPVDVRPAATMWKVTVFSALHGYDGRFEGGEDLQLAWKALHGGGKMIRAAYAKQIYRAKPKKWLANPVYCKGHVTFLEWLITERKATREQINEWYPRLLSQNALHTVRQLSREWRALGAYTWRNLHKLRPW